jgi:selenocysteine-specific elongation factor
MEKRRHVILATAGHVDHGKTALVKALTGVDPDRLPEEKARGITIELGFAHLELSADDGTALSVGVVDVPGHEDFVKNMVAGVGSIDAALLIVAANEGWMPQTEEHLQILTYLVVSRGVVALTKADLVADVAGVIAEVRRRLEGTPFAGVAVVPTSVPTGTGLAELTKNLAAVLSSAPEQRDIGKPRLPLDRVFTLKGVGTVGTGTLTGGALKRGQAVVVQPGGLATRARTLHSHSRDIEEALPGSRVAVNLPGLHARGAEDARGEAVVGRGDVLTLAELGAATDTLDVLLWRSPRSFGGVPPRPVKDLAPVHVHHGSGAVAARVRLLDASELPAGGRALAQLRLARPVLALAGDRLVVRDWSEQQTLAGAVVLDPDARRDRARSAERLTFLRARAGDPTDAVAFVASHLERYRAARRSALLVRSRFAAAEVEAACAKLVADGRAVCAGDWLADRGWWEGRLARAGEVMDAHHGSHPEQSGIPVTELLMQLHDRSSADADRMIGAVLVDALCRDGVERVEARLKRASHRPRLPAHLQAAGERIRDVLSRHPFDPPSKNQLLTGSASLQALKFLILNGEARELGPEQVIGTAALTEAAEIVRAHIARHGPSTVAELKTALGSSRRIVVPLLEHLDRVGLTARQGDRRILRRTEPT